VIRLSKFVAKNQAFTARELAAAIVTHQTVPTNERLGDYINWTPDTWSRRFLDALPGDENKLARVLGDWFSRLKDRILSDPEGNLVRVNGVPGHARVTQWSISTQRRRATDLPAAPTKRQRGRPPTTGP
jgi:hypothetical protein